MSAVAEGSTRSVAPDGDMAGGMVERVEEQFPPMIFSLRISLPDRPGTLGRVATAFGKGDVNILTLDVVDREAGVAVDDLRVEAPRGMQEALRRAAAEVPGFAVEYVRPLEAFRHVLEPLELAALLEDSGREALATLVGHLPDTFGASWAIAVDVGTAPPEVLAASIGAPSVSRLPEGWLDFGDLAPLPTGASSGGAPPPRSRQGKGGLEVAAALLAGDSSAVLLGRERGPRFRASELLHLRLLARMAAAEAGRPDALLEVT
jgi:hypothetical protein